MYGSEYFSYNQLFCCVSVKGPTVTHGPPWDLVMNSVQAALAHLLGNGIRGRYHFEKPANPKAPRQANERGG